MEEVKENPIKRIDKRVNRKSQQALNVANEVIRRIKAGEPINLTEIQVRNGYHITSARSQKAIKTKTYQKAVMPVLERMKRVHEKAIKALDDRDLSNEKTDSVVNVAKQMLHDTQLLSGKATEHIASNIVVYGSQDFLQLQLQQEKKQSTD